MTVLQLPSKSWRAIAYLGRDSSGRQIRKSFTHPEKKQAVAMAAAYEAQHKNITDRLSFTEAMHRFLRAKRPFIDLSTYGDYDSKRRVLSDNFPSFCAKRVHAITSADLRALIAEMQTVKPSRHRLTRQAKAMAPKTIKNYLGFISGVFKNEQIPMPVIDQPKQTDPDIYVPTDSEVRTLLDAVRGSDMYVPVLLAAFGPLRRGEVCALEYPRDFDGNVIHVQESIGRASNNKIYRKDPKTRTSNRFIEMPPSVIDEIRKQGFVTELKPGMITSRFPHVLKSAGLPRFRFHDLRHYCVSTLHAQGVPDAYIMQRGGWKTDRVLKAVYRHTLADQEAAFAARAVSHFDQILG